MTNQPVLYVNGRFTEADAPALSPLDRGFSIADGLFETMIARSTRIFRLADHLARLRAGADLLAIPLPLDDELATILRQTLERNALDMSTVRLTVTRGIDHGRGLAIPAQPTPTVVIRVTPRPAPVPDQPGLGVVVSSIRRDERSPLSRVKSLAYTANVLARLDAQRSGADDALLPNISGNLVCATSSNLFVVIDGILLTPPLEDGALSGVSRKVVLGIARDMGIQALEKSVSRQDILHASENFLTNVVTGPRPVTTIDGEQVRNGRPGPIALRIASAYWDLVEQGTGQP